MRPVAISAPVSTGTKRDPLAPAAAPGPFAISKRAPGVPVRLDFPANLDPVVKEQARQWLVRQIAKRAVEILKAQEPTQ